VNATARLAFLARQSDHVSPLLRELQRLRVSERIRFQLTERDGAIYLSDGLRRAADDDAGRRSVQFSSVQRFLEWPK